ncbi:MAG: type 4a pilus biogenesis protein PilO [Acidobacteria bacterium]|nr:type 4a pilus biogenesis protein PilO [Acidobacteriota bacterium]
MTLMPRIPPWLKRLGTPPALGGLVLALGWYLFVSGYGAEIELQRQQLDTLSLEVGQGAGLEQQFRDRSGRNRQLSSRLAGLEAALPQGGPASGLLRQLQEAAVASGLRVKGIRKMPGQEGETFFRQPHGLVLAGTYHDLGDFCGKLSGMAPVVSLEDLRIAAAGPEDAPHTITADLTAVLHLYRPAVSAVEAPVDPARPARRASVRYRARGRRDPFGRPRAAASAPAGATADVRPPGLKGQRVSDLRLVGLVKAGGEFTALATGLQDRTFLLKRGDRLFDGQVLEILGDRVVFSRRLESGAGGKRVLRVVKRLHGRPEEGGDER